MEFGYSQKTLQDRTVAVLQSLNEVDPAMAMTALAYASAQVGYILLGMTEGEAKRNIDGISKHHASIVKELMEDMLEFDMKEGGHNG